MDSAQYRRRSVSAQDRPSPILDTEETPVSSLKPLALQIDPPVPQTRKRRISGIDTNRRASASPDKERGQGAVQQIPSAPPPPAGPAQRLSMTTNRGERNSLAGPPQIVPQTTTIVAQVPAERGEKVRNRTSISEIVTSIPARKKSPADAGPSNRAETTEEDKEQGTYSCNRLSCFLRVCIATSPQRREQAEHESTLVRMAGRSSLSRMENAEVNVEEDDEGENGGRQTRRARKSVNYKEPSLHT